MPKELNQSISEKLENVLLSALWAFRAYGNQNGFKDQNKYAEVEIEKIKAFIQSKISEAYQEGIKKGEEYQRMSNLIHKKSILERIKNLSNYSQQEEWRNCKKQLEILNLSDPKNKEIFDEAKKKGL